MHAVKSARARAWLCVAAVRGRDIVAARFSVCIVAARVNACGKVSAARMHCRLRKPKKETEATIVACITGSQ